jgi:hypothetical protein
MVPLVPKRNKTKKQKIKKIEHKLSLCKFFVMASTYTKSNKKKGKKKETKVLYLSIFGDGAQLRPKATKKRGSQIVLKLSDGAHLHRETTKQKEKKGEPELPLCQD